MEPLCCHHLNMSRLPLCFGLDRRRALSAWYRRRLRPAYESETSPTSLKADPLAEAAELRFYYDSS